MLKTDEQLNSFSLPHDIKTNEINEKQVSLDDTPSKCVCLRRCNVMWIYIAHRRGTSNALL